MRLGATTVGLDDANFVSSSYYTYPNPVNDRLTISFSNTAMKESTLRLFSMDGKCMLANDISFNSNQEYSLNVSNLPAGMYVLDLQQGEKHEQQKIVKFEY